MGKPKVATAFLAGCFGCHMSILDIDERILKLVELVEFNRSPINDIKRSPIAAPSASSKAGAPTRRMWRSCATSANIATS